MVNDPLKEQCVGDGVAASAASQSEQQRTPQQQAAQRAGHSLDGVCVAGGSLPSPGGTLPDDGELLFKQRRHHGNYRVRFDKHGQRVMVQVPQNGENKSKRRNSSAFIDLVDDPSVDN